MSNRLYISPYSELTSTPIDTTIISSVSQVDVDGSRFISGDHKGHPMMVRLCPEEKKCTRIKVESLGETIKAECISYLDSGFLYIGSSSGDYQLLRLNSVLYPEKILM